MKMAERSVRIKRLREQITLLRRNATGGHEPYIVDALAMIADLLDREEDSGNDR